jgi:hypothetical protein
MLRLRRPRAFMLAIAYIADMLKIPTAEPLRKHVSLRLSRSPKALEGGIGAAALVLVIVPLAIAVRIELRSVRADRWYRERAKSSDREQQAS